MNVQDLARSILSGGKKFVSNAQEDYRRMGDPSQMQNNIDRTTDMGMNMVVGGMTGPAKVGASGISRLVTDIVRKDKVAQQIPHVLDIVLNGKSMGTTNKVYSSIAQALKAAKMKPAINGQFLRPRPLAFPQ